MTHIIEVVRRADDDAALAPHPPNRAAVGLGGVYVVFTSVEATLRAVEAAQRLARAMRLSLTLIHFRSVGFAAPLEEPGGLSPVQTDAFWAQLEAKGCDVRVRVCLCRDAFLALRSALTVPSVVVIGGRHHWWPTRSERWRRALESEGHFVVTVDEVAGVSTEGRLRTSPATQA